MTDVKGYSLRVKSEYRVLPHLRIFAFIVVKRFYAQEQYSVEGNFISVMKQNS